MEQPESLFRSVVPSQLVSAIDETPGLIVPVLVAFAALEASPLDGTPIAHVPSVSIHLVYGCLAALLGVIMYAAGDYWDRTVFNPRYGPRGKLIGKKTRLLPDATDLDKIRRTAVAKLPDVNRDTQEGVYAAAEALLRDKGRWSEVEGPLVISKFVRSFIWPFLGAGLIMLLVAVLALSRRNTADGVTATVVAGVCWLSGFASFVPYLRFRVRHMSYLYRIAASIS